MNGRIAAFLLSVACCMFAQQPVTPQFVNERIREGKLLEAKAAAQKLLAQAEQQFGAESLEAAEALSLIANVSIMAAQLDDPVLESTARRALEIREKRLGLSNPLTAESANTLGGILGKLDRQAEARRLHERAIAIYESANISGPPLADSWKLLGNIAQNLGDNGEAIRCFDKAIALAPDQFEGLGAMVNKGISLRRMGRVPEALAAYRQAIPLIEKLRGPNHPSTALVLNNYGQLLSTTADLAEARRVLERVLKIWEQTSGPESGRSLDALAALARIAANQGDLEAAQTRQERVVAIHRAKLFGIDDNVASSIADLGLILARRNRMDEAVRALLEAEQLDAAMTQRRIRELPEQQAILAGDRRSGAIDSALTLIRRIPDPVKRSSIYDTLIRSRTLTFDEMAARKRVATGETAELSVRVAEARARLAAATMSSDQKKMADSAAAATQAERALAEKSALFRADLARQEVGLTQVAKALPAGATLISYVLYLHNRATAATTGVVFDGSDAAISPQYFAFVLRAGSQTPAAVPLGPAARIHDAILAMRKQVLAEADAPGQSPKVSEAAYRKAASELRALIWDPLAPSLGKPRLALIVPDGMLHAISFAALPVGDAGAYLIDTMATHLMTSERDLIEVQQSRGRGLLAIGDPTYDANPEPALVSSSSRFRGGSLAGCSNLRKLRFSRLAATGPEARDIASLWKRSTNGGAGEAQALLGADANEDRFKLNASGKLVLHLATHGFTLDEACVSDKKEESFDRPMLRSGLALAGANRRDNRLPDQEDGILTAEEAAAMDLSGVDWVVLSACSTGLGTFRRYEGAFGLPRAFLIAGARTVVVSLWPVDDQSTRAWMTSLYARRFSSKASTADALRLASLDMLNARRKRNESSHPFYWAGFVAWGAWR